MPDLARDPTLQKNVAHLADYDWTFDLQVFAGQMAGAAELAAACPKVTFILQHAGMPEDLSTAGMAFWRAAMQRLAAQPNVTCKLSALGTFIHRNDPDHIAAIVGETIEIFTPSRCLFGSNFPVEKLWTAVRRPRRRLPARARAARRSDRARGAPRHRDTDLSAQMNGSGRAKVPERGRKQHGA